MRTVLGQVAHRSFCGRWLVGFGVVLLALACGSSVMPAGSRPPGTDPAVELAALLPDSVDRCVVARPGMVPEGRRALVLLHSQAEPTAWNRELGVVAYASGVAEGEGGRQVRRSYYRLADPSEQKVRRVLAVRWLDEPCEGEVCRRAVARWLDEHTLEVARYEWPERRLPLSSGGCVQLARERPEAIEVSSRITEGIGAIHLLRPAQERATLRVSTTSLALERELSFDDPVEARILEGQIAHGRSIESALLPLAGVRREVERKRERITIRESRRWDELELAVEDERLRRQALALAVARREPLPVTRVRIDDLAAVRHQLRLRRAELARLGPEERARAATELAELLRRAWAAHPGEIWLGMALARLELDVRSDGHAALAVAEEVLARPLASPEWSALRREALAHVDPDALARALEADGLANRAEARAAAADLAALAALGVPYDWAEGAWMTARTLFDGPAPRHAVEVRIPIEALVSALVGWVRLREDARHLTVQVAIRSAARADVRAVGESRAEIVVVRAPRGGMLHVAALPSSDLVAMRRLGAQLASVLPSGPLEVAISLRSAEGEELVSTLRLAGSLHGEMFAVARVSSALDGVPWPLFTRYLANPLAELTVALFPPPTLTVRAESAELAAELRRSVESTHPGACTVAGPILRCRRPGRAEELGELLLRIASERVRWR